MRVQRLSATSAIEVIGRLTKRRSPVVFVGAGISARSGLPLAREVKAEMFLSLAHDILGPREKTKHFEQWQQRLDGVMLESLVEVFARQVPDISRRFASVFRFGAPNDAHHALAAQLAKRRIVAVITTNFDDLIERAYEDRRRSAPNTPPLAVIRTRRDKWDFNQPALIKLHGCVRKPHTIAITISRVGKGLESWKRVWLDRAAAHPFVICGYSDRDKDITPVLLRLRNDWIWLLHRDRTTDEHVPPESLLREMLEKPRRTVLLTDASAALLLGEQQIASGKPVATSNLQWSTTATRLVARIPKPRRRIILGDVLCELLGDDDGADRVYVQGLKSPGLSRHLHVELSSRRIRLLGDKWELERMEQLHRAMVRAAAPVHVLSRGDRATIERLHAALLRKRATRLSQEAEDALRRAEALSRSIADRENAALAQMNRAVVLQKRGRYKVAEPLYEKALIAFRRQGNLAALAKTLWDPLESTCRHASLSIL